MSFKKKIPNFLTIFRIILIIPIVWLLFGSYVEKIISASLMVVGGLTDYLDGFLARKWKAYSNFGDFMDPLADKLLILSILMAFLQLDPSIFPYWMVWMIICREFIITVLRIGGIQGEQKVKTLYIGKVKTTAQFLTILLIIVLLILKDFLVDKGLITKVQGMVGLPFDQIWFNYFGNWANFLTYTPSFMLGISTFFSVYSGIHYIFKNRHMLKSTQEEEEEEEEENSHESE